MDKYEVRRLNLRAAVRTLCGGKIAALADKINRSPSYASRMLYEEGKDGKKRIGEDMRDLIEEALSMQQGHLDNEEAALKELSEEPALMPSPGRAAMGSARGAKEHPSAAQRNTALPSAETTLERLDGDEKKLLELYRRATENGKLMIYGAATVAPKDEESDA